MKEPRKRLTRAVLPEQGRTDWKRLAAMEDDAINYKDIPELTDEFLETVDFSEKKKPVFIRLDMDVLDWFKTDGRGYQTRINAVLRAYMKAHKNPTHGKEAQ